eukprot:15485141-Alexandrium_andersonii.AAC.1
MHSAKFGSEAYNELREAAQAQRAVACLVVSAAPTAAASAAAAAAMAAQAHPRTGCDHRGVARAPSRAELGCAGRGALLLAARAGRQARPPFSRAGL